jgi:hypothetical protein
MEWILSIGIICFAAIMLWRMQLAHVLSLKKLTSDEEITLKTPPFDLERERLEIEREKLKLLTNSKTTDVIVAALADGHDAKCSYCGCGHSKKVDGLATVLGART